VWCPTVKGDLRDSSYPSYEDAANYARIVANEHAYHTVLVLELAAASCKTNKGLYYEEVER